MQKLGTKACVFLSSVKLPERLCAEAIHYGNWLRSRMPAEIIDGEIPILSWDGRTRIELKTLPEFGQRGLAFLSIIDTKQQETVSSYNSRSFRKLGR